MNSTASSPRNAVPLREHALVPFEPHEHARYSLEMVARLAQVSRHRVAVYCRYGMVSPAADPTEQGWTFDASVIRTVRQLEDMRQVFGVNLMGARLFLRMMREIEELRRELRFVRDI